MSKCDTVGHAFQPTPIAGWFQCQRVLTYRTSKRTGRVNPVVCGLVCHCPGCLGSRLEGYTIYLCPLHAHDRIEDFPVYTPQGSNGSPSSSSVHQSSLWA